MNQILDLIRQHGELFYLITFVWTALEGETFVIFAGLAAQRDLLDIRMLFFAAGFGSMLGDQIWFFTGRYFGRRILKRFPKIEPKLEKVFVALEKYSTSFILTYRFMYGLRNISALAIGMSPLPWKRFFVLNFIASFMWAFVFCGAGYAFGDLMERMGIADEESVNFEVRGIMITVLSLFILIVLGRYWHKARMAKEDELLKPVHKDFSE
ncbi:MAG: DedA family protein [Proteobacteria bacterium]|jgi:membrane protein DedA with SNARE-associated domain|nr:DedA family protein [Alphaproteobacteria bacterium]NCC03287.1 DedA family protein [Pseudomonadota bacterium]